MGRRVNKFTLPVQITPPTIMLKSTETVVVDDTDGENDESINDKSTDEQRRDAHQKPGKSRCVICGLGDSNISRFKFPKDQQLREAWAKFCGIASDQINTSTKVCEFHFTSDDFSDTRINPKRRNLKRGVVPSITYEEIKRQSQMQENERELESFLSSTSQSLIPYSSHFLSSDGKPDIFFVEVPSQVAQRLPSNYKAILSSHNTCENSESTWLPSSNHRKLTSSTEHTPKSTCSSPSSSSSGDHEEQFSCDGSETTAVSDTNECILTDFRNGTSSSPDFTCPKKAKHRYDIMKYKVEKLKKKNKQLHNQNFYLKQKVRSLEKIIAEFREKQK